VTHRPTRCVTCLPVGGQSRPHLRGDGEVRTPIAGEEFGREAPDVDMLGMAVVFEESCVGDQSPSAGPSGSTADAEPVTGPSGGADDEGCVVAFADPLTEQEHDGRHGDGELLALGEEHDCWCEQTGRHVVDRRRQPWRGKAECDGLHCQCELPVPVARTGMGARVGRQPVSLWNRCGATARGVSRAGNRRGPVRATTGHERAPGVRFVTAGEISVATDGGAFDNEPESTDGRIVTVMRAARAAISRE